MNQISALNNPQGINRQFNKYLPFLHILKNKLNQTIKSIAEI